MATALTIGTVPLEEIHDLRWPTDRHLVQSFRKTLQHGGHFAPMHLNRVWQPETSWHYEVIDGFHRYEAAKAEGVASLLCQVVELGAREARYARIQACVGKPAEITRERALRELRLAFISDMRVVIGNPEVLYEPILGEDGQVQARPRKAPLPEEPLAALEALTDHLLATQAEALPYPVERGQQVINRTPFGRRTGWEQQLNDWIAELGERFGYDASWLFQEVHLQVLQEQGLGQGWTPRQRDAFQRQGGYAFHALWLWNVPDVELRAVLRRQLQSHPEQGEWLWKALTLMGFTTAPQVGKPFQSQPKSALFRLLIRILPPGNFISLCVTAREAFHPATNRAALHQSQQFRHLQALLCLPLQPPRRRSRLLRPPSRHLRLLLRSGARLPLCLPSSRRTLRARRTGQLNRWCPPLPQPHHDHLARKGPCHPRLLCGPIPRWPISQFMRPVLTCCTR